MRSQITSALDKGVNRRATEVRPSKLTTAGVDISEVNIIFEKYVGHLAGD
ncbi:hypothetical protein GJU94_08875 [Brucella sp. 10RB9214]|nr:MULTISPECIES: hypothetical protein [Brucella]MRN45856.1 hypothetical protein [Brucella sp. 10RB9212]MRN49944.1 hypothetical protein [Brucella sp. 10RB9214]QPA29268.1 hypothetical protein IR196_13760 [Brucella anthropi]